MIQRPKLKGFLTLYPIDEHVWGVRGGDGEFWSIRLAGDTAKRCLGLVLPCLTGSRTRQEILDEVAAAGLEVATGEELLDRLEKERLIENPDDAGLTPAQQMQFDSQIKLFSRFSDDGGAKHQAALLESRVAVVGTGPLAEPLCRSLRASGIGQVTLLQASQNIPATTDLVDEVLPLDRESIFAANRLNPPPKVVVVAQEVHDPDLMEAMHVFSGEHDIAWLLVRMLNQVEGWVGPLFVPRETASYVSFEARLRGNMQHYDDYVAFDEYARGVSAKVTVGGLHAFFDMLSGIAVTEVVKYVSDVAVPELAGKFISVNLWTLETEIHEVLRLPRIEDEAYSRPGVFPWKELPRGRKTRRA